MYTEKSTVKKMARPGASEPADAAVQVAAMSSAMAKRPLADAGRRC